MDRKARLKALAAKAGRLKEPWNDDDGGNGIVTGDIPTKTRTEQKPKLVFRNYTPQSNLHQRQDEENEDEKEDGDLPNLKKQKTEDHDTQQLQPISSSSLLYNALSEARNESKKSIGGHDNATNSVTAGSVPNMKDMAPKKINADLKRGISDKLAKLERRTQRVLVSMLKERLVMDAERAASEERIDDSDDLD